METVTYPAGPYPQRFTPPVEHVCPYIYTLPNDTQIRSNAHRIMMEDIRAWEDDDIRLQAKIASMARALFRYTSVIKMIRTGKQGLNGWKA